MLSSISFIIGLLIIFISIIFIIKHSDRKNVSEDYLNNDDELIITIESLENIIEDINDTFNNTVNQIEKKYELLESKIHHIDKKKLENYKQSSKNNTEDNDYYENNINNNIDIETYIEEKEDITKAKFSEIIGLKNRGLSVQQIAKELNIGTGEVCLILNLKKFKE